jgi:tetratricopeptide (TPR) repeat protein
LRDELHPAGFELVDVCLEMGGADVARRWVDEALEIYPPLSRHPSLLDQSHLMDARFGVTNIPMVLWIDETGTVVRGPEPATPPAVGATAEGMVQLIGDGEFREKYAAKLRDWVAKGAESRYAYEPDEVLARSKPTSPAISQAAAHFEIAQHIWRRDGLSERALTHFNAAHELQPANITYKRQAYSYVGVERSGDEDWGRFRQAPEEGEDWPFVSDFNRDLIAHDPALAKKLGLT